MREPTDTRSEELNAAKTKERSQRIVSVVLNDFQNDNRVLKMCKTLRKHGCLAEVVALWRPGLELSGQVEEVPYRRIKLKTYSWPSALNFFKMLEFSWRLRWNYRSKDIWLLNDFEALLVYALGALLGLRVKIAYDSHELQSDRAGMTNPWYRRMVIAVERLFLKATTPVFNVSPGIVNIYEQRYGLKNQHLIMNLPEGRPELGHHSKFRDRWPQIHPDATVFICQGKLTRQRGLEILVQAFERLNPDEFVLVLMGFGPMYDELAAVAEASPNIYIHPAVPHSEITDYTSSADWGITNVQNICLSYLHSLPNKLFEYVQSGIPVIASNLEDTENFIRDNEVGLVMDGESIESVVNTLREARELGAARFGAAVLRAAEKYRWERQEPTIVKTFDELASS